MSDVKTKAVEQAVKLLKAAGAEFCVRFNGQQFGELVADKAPRTRPNYIDVYREQLDSLEVGGVAVFVAPHETASALRGSITAYASHHFGNGNYVSTITKDGDVSKVEIMRVQ